VFGLYDVVLLSHPVSARKVVVFFSRMLEKILSSLLFVQSFALNRLNVFVPSILLNTVRIYTPVDFIRCCIIESKRSVSMKANLCLFTSLLSDWLLLTHN
jgi:hypothetical protein